VQGAALRPEYTAFVVGSAGEAQKDRIVNGEEDSRLEAPLSWLANNARLGGAGSNNPPRRKEN